MMIVGKLLNVFHRSVEEGITAVQFLSWSLHGEIWSRSIWDGEPALVDFENGFDARRFSSILQFFYVEFLAHGGDGAGSAIVITNKTDASSLDHF